jgi:hypothetical protein
MSIANMDVVLDDGKKKKGEPVRLGSVAVDVACRGIVVTVYDDKGHDGRSWGIDTMDLWKAVAEAEKEDYLADTGETHA